MEALQLPFDLYHAVWCVPLCGHRMQAVKWRVLEHAVSGGNGLCFLAIMGLPPSGSARSPGSIYLQTFFIKVLPGSTCWVGIQVREVIKCSRLVCPRFDIWQFFQVAQAPILGGIRTCCGVRPRDEAHNDP